MAAISQGTFAGRGECVPYARYGETVEGVAAQIEAMADAVSQGASRNDLLTLMPPGAARNALDCALWDLEAKLAGKRAWTLAGLPEPRGIVTAVYAEPGHAEGHGSGGTQRGNPPPAQGQAGRAW